MFRIRYEISWNNLKYFIIIQILSTIYIFVHLLDNKMFHIITILSSRCFLLARNLISRTRRMLLSIAPVLLNCDVSQIFSVSLIGITQQKYSPFLCSSRYESRSARDEASCYLLSELRANKRKCVDE